VVKSATHKVDVAIVGGGMAGASLALMLERFCPQLSVTLLEQRRLAEPSASIELPSFDTRATALAAGSLQMLAELDLWPQLQEYCAPISRIQVSDRGRALGVSLGAERQAQASFAGMFGAVIENAALGPVLYRALAQTSVQLLAPAQVESVQMHAEGARLSWRDTDGTHESALEAQLLVVADGVNSPLCQQLGIEVERVAYQQRALITTLGMQRDHGGVAYERFTDNGPMALLPLPKRDSQHRMALASGSSARQSPGQLNLLQAYGRERQLDQQLTIGFSDRVPPLFASSNLVVRGLRQAGLLGLTLAPPLRASFLGQAAGFGL